MNSEPRRAGKLGLLIATLGVVFGDIGTSPLYALRECFSPARGLAVIEANVLGVLSLIIWTLTLVVCVKYLAILLNINNRGDGGILALVSLVSRFTRKKSPHRLGLIPFVGIIGTALLLSDGIITPSISVLSAIEGLTLVYPKVHDFIVPLSIMVLFALFLNQAKGSEKVGKVFGPVIGLWFITLAVLGMLSIVKKPDVLYAFNPWYGINFFLQNKLAGFSVLASIFLVVTGTEVLYADMGHFGASPIRKTWYYLVYPALLLNYLGQGSHLLMFPNQFENLFFRIAPSWAILPLVALATAATIIASQAVISGAFSLGRQCVQLGYWPRIQIKHTSEKTIGQVYVPFVNWLLFFGSVSLILTFTTSGNLAGAYGIAVSATMLLTTILMIIVALKAFKINPFVIIPLGLIFIFIELAYFLANLTKLASGGWIIALFSCLLFILMKTWIKGKGIFAKRIAAYRMAPELFAASIALNPPLRVPGTALFLTADPNGVPKSLLHNLKHNRILHETTVILSVITEIHPYMDAGERLKLIEHQGGIWHLTLYFGYKETPDIPKVISELQEPSIDTDRHRCTYFLGREAIVPGKGRDMSRWRKKIFTFLFNNASSPTEFFRLPPERVVEIGAKTDL